MEKTSHSMPLQLLNEELAKSENYLITLTQMEYFENEIKLLMNSRTISCSSCLQNLDPSLDPLKILRVGGRARKSDS